jgi:malate synthase
MQSMLSEDTGGFDRTVVHGLAADPIFYQFIETELLPRIGMGSEEFWSGLAAIINDLTPVNRHLLARRDALQKQIDDWHRERPGRGFNHTEYVEFLTRIGYLREPGEPFRIETLGVDAEIATVAGPQLVVPVSNARFALNAANARWGSLYDALYGTDVIPADQGRAPGGAYNPTRGKAVIEYAAGFLDEALPLDRASHAEVDRYAVERADGAYALVIELVGGQRVSLRDPASFVGFAVDGDKASFLFRHHGLHIEIVTDPRHPVGKSAAGHVADVILESAVTTIQDCEDSVAAVDAEDKVGVYRNWLGLMTGELTADFEKGGKRLSRTLAADKHFTAPDGSDLVLPGRSLMLVRNVGHLMTNDALLDTDGKEVFEGILDAVVTTACALANHQQEDRLPNSRFGSIYIVKPKMHGPDEVRFTDTLFRRVEELFGIDTYTLKVGVMDEERRTTANLHECIHAVKDRLVFINTGFLDRTGDEIHTSMQAGPVLPKETIKLEPWINAYEDWNVDVGIRCGLPGKAQIGKGMWPKPDEMAQMMATKQAHPEAGANCAWVPSPTAATLHAMHYHAVDVRARQEKLATRRLASLDDILTPPLCDPDKLDADTIQNELDNNAQGILGYVVRWIDQGIGCSKVPDIEDVGLMEDRATLRISSQHIANWLAHGVTSETQVMETMRRMAAVVDEQNAVDPNYRRMSDDFDASIAFQAACDLVFKGAEQPNGYTEPLLHAHRRRLKARLRGA